MEKSRGPGVAEHEVPEGLLGRRMRADGLRAEMLRSREISGPLGLASTRLPRVFSVGKWKNRGIAKCGLDIASARFGVHRAEKSRGPGVAEHEVPEGLLGGKMRSDGLWPEVLRKSRNLEALAYPSTRFPRSFSVEQSGCPGPGIPEIS